MLHDLIEKLTKNLNLTPEQQFRVTADIKRLVHEEKSHLLMRMCLYSEDSNAETIRDLLNSKQRTHEAWSNKPDEEIVTWDVGTHRFVQKIPPCSDCKIELGRDSKVAGYVHTHDGEKTPTDSYYCPPCAVRRGLWELDPRETDG